MIDKEISHYRIIEKLGAGGMGVVYKAEDTKLKRTIALKFLPPAFAADPAAKERFIHEAQTASSLQHSNICTIHEIDETDDGQMYIAMDYYDGEILRDKIKNQKLKIKDAIDIATQIASGLQKAHEKGIIHRDIKPANIIITADGEAKILDFGLAKLSSQTKLTKSGSTLGTVAYMSPEQARGEPVDHRSDIWSLGVVLYEMVTGKLPFEAEYDQAVLYAIINETPEPVTGILSDLPLELEQILKRCLNKDPSDRYENTDELLIDLKNLICDFESLHAPSKPHKKVKKKRSFFWSAVVLVITLLFIIGYFIFSPGLRQPESERIMLVVLPFENLGPAEDVYFADGITEEITSRLSSLTALGVISRKSAIHYANTDKTAPQIGEELNVDYILEGTVRWAKTPKGAGKVRITPQLIRVSDDTHIWAENYEGSINDIFKTQTGIAEKVVEQLDIKLLETDQSLDEIPPTDNIDAYNAYLRGRYYAYKPHFSVKNGNLAIQGYQQAVELDSGFALAHAELARIHARFYNLKYDFSEKRLKIATEAAAKALKFGKDQPKVHLALGYYYLWAFRDHNKALEHLMNAEKHMPNNVDILRVKAAIFEPEGRWEEYIKAFEQIIKLFPHDASDYTDIALGLWWTHQYEKAIKSCDKAITLDPGLTWPYLYKAYTLWGWKGADEASRSALTAVNADHEFYYWSWYWQEVGEGNYQAALDLISGIQSNWIRHKLWARPKSMYLSFIYQYLNKSELAYEGYKSSIVLLEEMVKKHPDDPRYHSSLGIAYAGIGQRDEAIREGKKAVELLPLSKDAAYGIPYVQDLAVIYTMTGEYNAALDQIELLLSIPSWISVGWLKMDIRFNSLRTNPRYKQLLKKYSDDY